MRIIIGAGGTGGHVYPALALANYIKQQDPSSEFLFVGTKDRLEATVVPQAGYAYQGLHVKGLTGNIFQKGIEGLIFLKSIIKAKKIVKQFKPDVVIGFGGYPSASIVLAASMLHVKTIIHEQNSIVGLTNKILLKRVDKIVCCYEKALEVLPKEKTLLLGNPRASVIVENKISDIHEKYGFSHDKKLIVVVMGSLGSQTVNHMMKDAIKEIASKDYQLLYVTGKPYYDEFVKQEGTISDNIKIIPYCDDLPSALSSCDLVVSRAGATTLAEITALGTPALIIPSPYVVANHQEYNARELVEKEASQMILEKELTSEKFVSMVDWILTHDLVLETMKKNARALGKPNACKDMYQVMLQVIGE